MQGNQAPEPAWQRYQRHLLELRAKYDTQGDGMSREAFDAVWTMESGQMALWAGAQVLVDSGLCPASQNVFDLQPVVVRIIEAVLLEMSRRENSDGG